MSFVEELRKLPTADLSQACIRYSSIGETTRGVDGDKFNELLSEFIQSKLDSGDLLTEDITTHLHACMNYIYLDGDYLLKSDKDFDEVNSEAAKLYTEAWIDALPKMRLQVFIFIPVESKQQNGYFKGGFHTFIICENDIDDREQLYNKVISSSYDKVIAPLRGRILDEDASVVYDKGPLVNNYSNLIPFSKKNSKSRNYILHDWFYVGKSTKKYDKTYKPLELLPNIRTPSTTEKADTDNHISLDGALDLISGIGLIIYNAFESLPTTLNPQHEFWTYIANHDNKWRLIRCLTDIFIFSYIYKHNVIPGNIDAGLATLLSHLITPMMDVASRKVGDASRRATQESINQNIREAISSSTMHTIYTSYPNLVIHLDDAQETSDKLAYPSIHVVLKEKKDGNFNLKALKTTIKEKTLGAFSNIAKVVISHIYRQMTNEIESINVTTNKWQHAVDNIKPLILMGYLVFGYNNRWQRENGIYEILYSLVNKYVMVDNQTINSKDKLFYIYNVRQSIELVPYPYNQWLRTKEDVLVTWFNDMYMILLKSQLERIHADTSGLTQSIGQLICIEYNNKIPTYFSILNDFNQAMSVVLKGILSSRFDSVSVSFPTFTNDCGLIPVRNGIVELYSTQEDNHEVWKHKLVTDNRRRILPKYSNMPYSDDFDFSSIEAETIRKLFMDIYADTDERNYAMMIFSFALHSIGTRDALVIAYGTGGDGKTTISNFLSLILGNIDGKTITESIKGHPCDIQLRQLEPMCSTMQPEALLEKAHGSGNHNAGGLVQLANARFTVMEEPDVTGRSINCATVKSITGGGTLNVRDIYKSSITIQPNSLLFLATNDRLPFSENGVAITRRIIAIPHKTKFIQENMATRLRRVRGSKIANTNLFNEFSNNPKMWQALFHILLQKAIECLNHGWKSPASVPMPIAVTEFRDSLMRSVSGATEHIDIIVTKCDQEQRFVPMAELVKQLVMKNRLCKPADRFLSRCTMAGTFKELEGTLFNKFMSEIIYLPGEDMKYSVLAEKLTNEDEYKRMYNTIADGDAISNTTLMNTSDDYENLYILNYSIVSSEGVSL